MKTSHYSIVSTILLICLLFTGCSCNSSTTSPTRVASHETKEVSPKVLLDSSQIEILNANANDLFAFDTINTENKDPAKDTFLNTVYRFKKETKATVGSGRCTIENWSIPIWSTGKKTWWKNSIPFKNSKETLWIESDGTRQDAFEIIPRSFISDTQNRCMCFQQWESEFTFVDEYSPDNPQVFTISNPFPFVSSSSQNPNAYSPSSLHSFQLGYLLVVSTYGIETPYRFLFFPKKNNTLQTPYEIEIPLWDNHEWFPADYNYLSNTFVLLDHQPLIDLFDASQIPGSTFEESDYAFSTLLLIDLLNPTNPFLLETPVTIASAARLINHPEGVQLFVFPRSLENYPIQTPVWIRESNSIRKQNPVYISLDGFIENDTSCRYLNVEPYTWLLFVNGKKDSHEGWILSCTARTKELQIQSYPIQAEQDFILPSISKIQNQIYYVLTSKQSFYSMEMTKQTMKLQSFLCE